MLLLSQHHSPNLSITVKYRFVCNKFEKKIARVENKFHARLIDFTVGGYWIGVVMILPQVHLRKPCYDFTFL